VSGALPLRRPGLGIALMLLATVCFASLDNTVRYLGGTVPVLALLWVRYLCQALVMAGWLLRPGSDGFRTAHPKFQAMRGALLLTTSALSFTGVQYMQVAEYTAINMLAPVLVTLLAAWLLKEQVSPLRWALVVGCFGGALIVIRPGSGIMGWPVVFPLAAAASYAVFQVLTSKLSSLESPTTTHFYTGAIGVALLTPLLLLHPELRWDYFSQLPPTTLGLMLMAGMFGTTGHMLLILALGLAAASTLMPFIYAQIAVAAAIGWLVFDHLPDGWSWVGMAVVAACGAATVWLNVREAAARRQPTSTVQADTLGD
jgi:drug/metabolite transporter (DMT)-like permease